MPANDARIPHGCAPCISGSTAAQCMHAVDKTVVAQAGRYENSTESVSGWSPSCEPPSPPPSLPPSLPLSLSFSGLFSFLEPPPRSEREGLQHIGCLSFPPEHDLRVFVRKVLQVTPTSYLFIVGAGVLHGNLSVRTRKRLFFHYAVFPGLKPLNSPPMNLRSLFGG